MGVYLVFLFDILKFYASSFFFVFQFGNTCYVNSVLQALYFCRPLREKLIEYKHLYTQRSNNKELNLTSNSNNEANAANNSNNSLNDNLIPNGNVNGNGSNGNQINSITKDSKNSVSILKQEHLLICLAELFYSIVSMKKKKGIIQPKKFITRLRKDNGKSTISI